MNFLAAIFGQHGGPTSSTSMAEALKTNCWSSTPAEGQVVCPRPSNGSQGLDLAGDERFELLALESRRQRRGFAGVLWQRHRCTRLLFLLLSRVFLVKWRVPSSNVRLLRAIDVKGLSCNLYLPLVVI
jgi:hypothetical protein